MESELAGMKMRALQKKAEELGVDEARLDDAEDKAEVIVLIMEKVEQQRAAEEAARLARLQEELGGMKMRALQKKAGGLGVDEARLDDAEDKAEVIALIMELEAKSSPGGGEESSAAAAAAARAAEAEAARLAELKDELSGMKMRALQKRAEEMGVGEAQLDEAEDPDAVIALILQLVEHEPQHRAAGSMVPEGVPPNGAGSLTGVLPVNFVAPRGNSAQPEPEIEAEPEPQTTDALALSADMAAAAVGGGEVLRRSEEAVAVASRDPPDPVSHPRQSPSNEPGHWDAMISYTQRNPTSETLAVKLSGELQKRGLAVWLDVEMGRRDEAAMREGVENSRCVVAVVSGPPGADAAYFRRPFCLSELRWAHAAAVPVVPVVSAEDKGIITEFFADIPDDLSHIKSANWEHIDRKDADYFRLGVDKIIRAACLHGRQPEPEPELEPVLGLEGSDGADLRRIHSADGSGGVKSDPAKTIFGSMRFPVPPEALQLQAALQQQGVTLTIIAMKAG